MGLDLWFPEDVTRILAAVQETMRAATDALQCTGAGPAATSEAAGAYQRGFVDALGAVAVAFGVRSARPVPNTRWTNLLDETPSAASLVSGDWVEVVNPRDGCDSSRLQSEHGGAAFTAMGG
jgi:hypothetical protein